MFFPSEVQGKSLAGHRAAGPNPTSSEPALERGSHRRVPLEGCSETKSGVPAFQCCSCLRADKTVTKENDSMVKGKHQGLLDTEELAAALSLS